MNFEMRFRGFVSSRVRLGTTVPIIKSRDPEFLDWYSIQPLLLEYQLYLPVFLMRVVIF